MIKLNNLSCSNFMSYEQSSFDFNKGFCLIDGFNYDENDANAAGKTGVFNCLSWVIYANLPRDVKVEEVVRRGQKNCTAVLNFEENGVKYKIERGRKPNYLKFYIDGTEVEEEPQKAIDRVIGLSLKTFYRCVYYPQDSDTNYLISNDRDKKEILTNILDELSVFDRAYIAVKDDMRQTEIEKGGLANTLLSLVNNAKRAADDITFYEGKRDKFDTEKLSKVERLQNSKKDNDSMIANIETKIAMFQKSLKPVEMSSIAKIDERLSAFVEFDKAKSTVLTDRASYATQKNMLTSGINKILRDIEANKGGNCPMCGQVTAGKSNEDMIAHQKKDIDDANGKIEALNGTILDLEAKLVWIDEQIKQKAPLLEEKAAFEKTMRDNDFIANKEIPSLKSNIETYRYALQEIDKNIDLVKNEANTYQEMIEKLGADITTFNTQIEESSVALRDKETLLADLKILEEAFGKNGIKSYVFESIILEMNDTVQKYLNELFEKEVTLTFNTSKEKASGEVVQEFKTTIMISGEEVSFGSLSGGERRRAILAVDLALADIIGKRSAKAFNVKFFDESFDGMSSAAKEKVMGMLKGMSKDLDMVGVIDHSTEFRGVFDNVVRIELRNGISVIKSDDLAA